MTHTIKAILSRCNGDRSKAVAYCYGIIDAYPALRAEYSAIVDALLEG